MTRNRRVVRAEILNRLQTTRCNKWFNLTQKEKEETKV